MVGRADAPQAGPPYQVHGCTATKGGRKTPYALAVASLVDRSRAVVLGAAFALALTAGASGCASSGATFPASGPCLADGRQPGAYPDLERQIPPTFEGHPPDRLDSGRNCSDANLGLLKDHGIREVRFAGGLWQLAPATGVTLAIFTGNGLQADWLAAFYEAGARAAPKVSGLSVSHPSVGGRPAFRLDYADAGTPQTIVVWPAGEGTVHVVLAAGVPDRIVQEAIAAFG
jgi:hypothetical protein